MDLIGSDPGAVAADFGSNSSYVPNLSPDFSALLSSANLPSTYTPAMDYSSIPVAQPVSYFDPAYLAAGSGSTSNSGYGGLFSGLIGAFGGLAGQALNGLVVQPAISKASLPAQEQALGLALAQQQGSAQIQLGSLTTILFWALLAWVAVTFISKRV